MRRPCCPVAHNVPPQGDDGEAGSSSPGHVRREPITFHCCFSTLCKEQSALISAGLQANANSLYHADRLQAENQGVTVVLFPPGRMLSLADKLDFFFLLLP